MNLTKEEVMETEMRMEKEFLDSIISLCPDSIIGVNRAGIIIVFNRAAEKLMGYGSSEVIGKMTIDRIYHPPALAREIKKKLYSEEFGEPGQLEGFETLLVTKWGRKVPIRLSATIIWQDGREAGSVGFFHDLTYQKDMEARLRELSITDSLSGLFNQRHFYTKLASEVERNRRYGRPLSLICLDIDRFKQWNDNLGHLEGDNVIRLVGQILRKRLRRSDMAFRYGGDEFMAILPETPLPAACVSAERIRQEFNLQWALGPLCEKSCLKPITLSMGVAQIGSGEMADTFVRRADLAMYEAKRAGGNGTVEANANIGKCA